MASEGAEMKAAEAGAAPPSYVGPTDVAPPPSYDSLFGKLKQAKEESDGNVDFVKTCCGILVGSVACTICLGIFLAIPIAMIAVGATYLHDCPAEKMIPIYLIVAGVFTIITNILTIIRGRVNNWKEGEEEKQSGAGPEHCIICFLFAWFVAGNVWVYRTYDDWQSSNSILDNYCNPTLYYFSFWILISPYIVLGVLTVISIALGICTCIFGKRVS
ncbi:transmembrane protein 272-like isoform X1 [Mytilus galloprovincialis]|uniref:transmembrane protein 272-like isoform X1 n=1 Tax=Mytilus galloprovincialis TaxID=29158 RepID=UPI003F7B92CB